MNSGAREVSALCASMQVSCSASTSLTTVHFSTGFLGLDIHPKTASILAVAQDSQAGRAGVVRLAPSVPIENNIYRPCVHSRTHTQSRRRRTSPACTSHAPRRFSALSARGDRKPDGSLRKLTSCGSLLRARASARRLADPPLPRWDRSTGVRARARSRANTCTALRGEAQARMLGLRERGQPFNVTFDRGRRA